MMNDEMVHDGLAIFDKSEVWKFEINDMEVQ